MASRKIFTFSGRANRQEYFLHLLGGLILYTLVVLFVQDLPVLLILLIVVIADEICIAVRRFHDLDRPSSDYLLLLIPFYNIYLGFVLLFKSGTEGLNRYDEGFQPAIENREGEYACGRCGAEVKLGDLHCSHCGDSLEF